MERNNFKTVVEQFANRIKTVSQDIEDSVRSRKQKAVGSLTAARLESSLVFQIDDELILGVDTPSGSTSSIALGPRSNKQKQRYC